MRKGGRRLDERSIRGAPGVVGTITLHEQRTNVHGSIKVVSLHEPTSPVGPRLLPDLHDPVLVCLGNGGMRLRGIERIDSPSGAIAVVQEWICELE